MELINVYGSVSNKSGLRCYKDVEDRDDVEQLEVSVAEYKRLRRMARRAGAGRDIFLRRCARRVMEALR